MRFIPIIAAVSSVAYAGAAQARGEPAVAQYDSYNAYKAPPPAPAPPASSAPAPAPTNYGKVPLYGQCGAGEGKWHGPTECSEGTCHKQQQYYSQCVPEGNAPAPAPAPAPPANNSKVPLYGQCGAGDGKWDGPTECSEGTCHKQQQYYSQCVPEGGAPAPAPAPPAKQDSYSAPPAPSKVPLYGQCGAGKGDWTGPTECAEGSCMAIQEYYSQCLKKAPPKDSPPAAPKESTPAKEYTPPAAEYTPPTKEYSPAPKKPADKYSKPSSSYRRRQLVSGVTNNVGLTSDPTSKDAPAIPLIKAQRYAQCGGADYTGPSVCVEGSICKVANEYYSQCAPLST